MSEGSDKITVASDMAKADRAVRAGFNPAVPIWIIALVTAVSLVACGEKVVTAPTESGAPAALARPTAGVRFTDPLSTKLDDMMRAEKDVLVVGDPDFIARMRAQEVALGGSVYYLDLPQMDLYSAVAIYPAVLAAKAKMFVMESVPAYWSGEVYIAVQPAAGAVKAAMDQVPQVDTTPVAEPPPPGRDYIKAPTKPFNFDEPMKLVFDNYNGFWREIDDCLMWVTNDELLAATSPEFQIAYKTKFNDPSVLHTNVGHVGGLDYAATLLSQCKAAKAAAPGG